MRWVERNGAEYPLRKIRQTENSLGPRGEETERSFAAFFEGRERNRDLLAGIANRRNSLAKVNIAMGLARCRPSRPGYCGAAPRRICLAKQLLVVDTNALFAYEALAGKQIASGLTATSTCSSTRAAELAS